MHAQRIIQELLATECPSIHARRRVCAASMAQAGSKGGLTLMGMSRVVNSSTSLRHRIKRCDRLLGNSKLAKERHLIYGAMARRILCGMAQPLIIVDWSDLCPDRSRQLLRAALIVQGRALPLYEEVHPLSRAASLNVHRAFLKRLQALLPLKCQPIFITDQNSRPAPSFHQRKRCPRFSVHAGRHACVAIPRSDDIKWNSSAVYCYSWPTKPIVDAPSFTYIHDC